MGPSDNYSILLIDLHAFNPGNDRLEQPLLDELDLDILAFFIDGSCQLWIVLARVPEIVNVEALNAGRDQLVLLVVEMCKVHRAQLTHIEHHHNVAQLVHKDELEK